MIAQGNLCNVCMLFHWAVLRLKEARVSNYIAKLANYLDCFSLLLDQSYN